MSVIDKSRIPVLLRLFLCPICLMKVLFHSLLILYLLAICVYSARGDALRTQVFELEEGWNAIYLDVDPLVRYPADVFADTPVDIVASYEGSTLTKQFVSDSGVNMINKLGWATWYAPSRDDNFLTKLGAIYGYASYLVHASSECTFSIEGSVTCTEFKWKADAYNLVGFSLDAQAPPTFAQFFAGSAAHKNSSVYRLTEGVWKKVIDPSNTLMKSGEAFWVYADGTSSYQGPLNVSAGPAGMVILSMDNVYDVTVKNMTDYPVTPRIEYVVAASDKLPLTIVVDLIGDFWTGVYQVSSDMGDASWGMDLPVLEAGAGFKIPLSVQADKLEAAEVYSLLCIKSDLGTELWMPIKASREDLK